MIDNVRSKFDMKLSSGAIETRRSELHIYHKDRRHCACPAG
jgi:hypothetical protein